MTEQVQTAAHYGMYVVLGVAALVAAWRIARRFRSHDTCPRCKGHGWVQWFEQEMSCQICEGTGRVERID